MADESTAQFIAARIRAEAAEVGRLAQLHASTDAARITAQRQIIELEEQALAIERNLAKTKEQQLKADERLRQNAHNREMLAKREADLAKKSRGEQSTAQAADLRSQANDVRRLADLTAKTDKERLSARRQALDLERQALEIERQRATAGTGHIAITERLKANAHSTNLLRKQEDELAKKQNSTIHKMQGGVAALKGWWQEAAAAVYVLVSAVQRADDLMEQGFKNRAIMGNLPFEINSVRKSTLGLVSDFELARIAISANRLGVVQTGEQFAGLAEAGTMLGLSVGQEATKSVEDLTIALARGSPLILDNLGIQLKLSQAYQLYAERLNTTVAALSAEQKAEAFRIIGMEKALEASDRVKISVNEQEQAWIDARREYDALVRETIPKATEQMGGMWEALEGGAQAGRDAMPMLMSALKLLGWAFKPVVAYVMFFVKAWGLAGRVFTTVSGYLGRLANYIGEVAGELEDWLSNSWVGQAAGWMSDLGGEVKQLAQDSLASLSNSIKENVPYATEMANAYYTLKAEIFGTHEAMSNLLGVVQEVNAAAAQEVRTQLKKEDVEDELQVQREKAVKWAEYMVDLAEAQNVPAKEMEGLYQNLHQNKVELLSLTGDQVALEQQLRDENIRQVKAANAKTKGGGGSGPTDADRMRATGEIQLAMWEDEIRRLEILGGLRNTGDATAIAAANTRHGLALQTLDLERQVLEITRAKNSVEREQNAARLEQIKREMELVKAQKELDDRQVADDLTKSAVAETQARAEVEAEIARQDAARMGALIELSDYRYKKEQQDIRHTGEMAEKSANSDLKRLEATQTMERDLHLNRMKQIRSERDEDLRGFDARAIAIEQMPVSDDPERLAKADAQRQLDHDKKISLLDHEMDVRREMETEQVAMLQREQERNAAHWAEVEKGLGHFENLVSQAQQFAGFLNERAAAEQDAQLDRTVGALEQKGEAQKAAIDRELAAAKGNVQRQNDIRQKGARQEAVLQRQIELAQAQHSDRKKRQEMRTAGWALAIVSVVEGVKAIVAAASFNIPEALLHGAASTLAGIQAAMLLSGKIPGGGAVANMSSGGGAGGGMSGGESKSYSDPSNVPGSIPGEAARRESATASNGSTSNRGGTVININGNINSLGTIDEDAANNIGRQLAKTAYSRQA